MQRTEQNEENVLAVAPVVARTLCPFAVKAQLSSAPPYDEACSLRANLAESLDALTRFTERAETEQLDAFVYRFPVSAVGAEIGQLARLVRTLVEVLLTNDPVAPRRFVYWDALVPQWRLSYAGVDYFAPVFSPIYRKDHSRHTHGVSDSVFVLMQPNSSFHARLGNRAAKIRRNIRSRFADAGQEYSRFELEAHRFVLPLSTGDDAVKWYDVPPFPRANMTDRGCIA
ncbi:YqcI/YcgG family protein [Nocardia sp. NPDC052566]|uniref:YqcI/YcgG family protein n=1 Tax=Nocardia sp. NPDC052566 TaxID=3364330 RepID=UPI0037C9E36C